MASAMAEFAAEAEPDGNKAEKASPIRPLRASEVHDSRVRRIAATTPNMICPRERTTSRPALPPPVHESEENNPKVTHGVRVQTVNVNQALENCGALLENCPYPPDRGGT